MQVSAERRTGRRSTTAHHELISSADVEATNVYGPDNTKVREIDYLMIDKVSGRVVGGQRMTHPHPGRRILLSTLLLARHRRTLSIRRRWTSKNVQGLWTPVRNYIYVDGLTEQCLRR